MYGLIHIPFTFAYQIQSISIERNISSSRKVVEVFYFSQLVNNKPLVLYVTCVIGISSYFSFVLLFALNLLIYLELRKIMEKKKRLMMLRRTGSDIMAPPTPVAAVLPVRKSHVSSSKKNTTSSSASVYVIGAGGNSNKIVPVVVEASGKLISSADQHQRESLRRSLIMTLWLSLIFSTDRFVKTIYRTLVLIQPVSPVSYYLNAFSLFFNIIVYSSFFFVYMRTNKMFRKKFYEIFDLRCRKNRQFS